MAIVLGENQYGKAETRILRISRGADRHQIRDLSVTTTLRGAFDDAHIRGDQASVLPTDSQKNTCFAYASHKGSGEIEEYALELARHFAGDIGPVSRARVEVDEYRWDRISVAGSGHPHAFVRAGQDVRTTAVTVEGKGAAQRAWVVSGLKDLVVLKSTGSEFAGFLTDRYTTLAESHDRVLATSLTARWRYQDEGGLFADGASGGGSAADGTAADGTAGGGWAGAHAQIRQILLERFAELHSLALQQTLWEMGRAVLQARGDVAEVRLTAPNKHHFLADLEPFGLANTGEVYYPSDRPYGLLQCAVERDGAARVAAAWESAAAFG
jgi:urate oxidase